MKWPVRQASGPREPTIGYSEEVLTDRLYPAKVHTFRILLELAMRVRGMMGLSSGHLPEKVKEALSS